MILSCPSCSTRYSVAEDALGRDGRTVRCAKCGHSWKAEAAAPAEQEPKPEPEPAPRSRPHQAYRAKKAAQEQRRRRIAAASGWGAAAACLVVALGLGWAFRQDVVRALPQTAGAYAMAGAEANIYGMEIAGLVSERVVEDGEPALAVRAELRNIDRKTRAAPLARFDLRDAEGQEFFGWTVAPEKQSLAPGESVEVAAVLINPPARAVDVVMTLTDQPAPPPGGAAPPAQMQPQATPGEAMPGGTGQGDAGHGGAATPAPMESMPAPGAPAASGHS